MEIIKIITEQIGEELEDAKQYATMANKWKTEQPEAAKVFADLASEEMQHHKKLHNAVTRLIAKVREAKGEPPKEMMAVYTYLHEKHIEKAADVMHLQDLYNA